MNIPPIVVCPNPMRQSVTAQVSMSRILAYTNGMESRSAVPRPHLAAIDLQPAGTRSFGQVGDGTVHLRYCGRTR